jgi:hypothetical protein
MQANLPNSKWYKFRWWISIRDLLWLTLLCAVLVAWWIDRCKLEAEIEAAFWKVLEQVEPDDEPLLHLPTREEWERIKIRSKITPPSSTP